ncbi:MAG: FAD:protein FMN transferase [Propionibacteriaceae bacterium]
MDPATDIAGDQVRRYVAHVMGMPISLALRGREADAAAGRSAWDAVITELQEIDLIFSTYRDDSVISRLGRGELELRDCPPEVAEVLTLGEQAEEQSGGAFSVRLPLDPRRPDGPRRLDPTGVVKGWAAERAARHLTAVPDTDFCLSAGGDVVCRTSSRREPWRIGIEDPHDPSRVIAVVPIRTGAVATSGTARRGAHLIDARNGQPALGVAQVSVVGPSPTWADLDATAACAQGSGAPDWLRARPIRSAVVVAPDGTIDLVVPRRLGTVPARTLHPDLHPDHHPATKRPPS